MSRRQALQILGVSAAGLSVKTLFPSAWPAIGKPLASSQDQSITRMLKDLSPIDRTLGSGPQPRQFGGDQPDKNHRILWDKVGYIAANGGALPPPTEDVPLVIIGGGVSGLLSAYLLREYHPILLEQAPRMGGNARGESWNGVDYGIGAAYFCDPEAGSPLQQLYLELGIDRISKIKEQEDPFIFAGKKIKHFWSGETDPENRTQFVQLSKYFHSVYSGEGGQQFPDIPIKNPQDQKTVKHLHDLDRVSFKRHLESVVGAKLHPHIESALEFYCWSAFGTALDEVSAAAGLNFYASDLGPLRVAPAGNAGVAEQILKRLVESVPAQNLRPKSLVFDVQVTDKGTCVSYAGDDGKIRTIRAKSVIMACPKFVVSKILRDIEPERKQAFQKLRYHSYLVANVLIKKPITEKFYDLFLLGDAKSNPVPKATDVVVATFAQPNKTSSVLTLYWGLPKAGSRAEIYSPDAFEKYSAAFKQQIDHEIVGQFGLKPKDVFETRITRWGHPLPSADVGLIADGTTAQLRKPFRDQVFFVEQDNWMLPSFETSALEALSTAPLVRNLLSRHR